MAKAAGGAFASYNKHDDSPTLVGNWYEERCLKNNTGVNRYQTWVKKDEDSLYASRADGSTHMPTHPRVVEHSQQLRGEEWITHKQLAFQDPSQRKYLLAQYGNQPGIGPREQLEMKKMFEQASQQPARTPPEHFLETTHRTAFKAHSLEGSCIGARVMKDPDGRPAQRDPTFLSEAKIMDKATADRTMRTDATTTSTAASTARLDNSDIPITIYSEAAAKGSYTGTIYGTKAIGEITPFGKMTNFTKPLSDFTKAVVDE